MSIDRLSVSLALQALVEQMDVARRAQENATNEMGIRNNLIRDAREAGLPYRRLVKITQLSRQRLDRLISEPYWVVVEDASSPDSHVSLE